MKAERQNTTIILIDMQYHDSINAFEEFYGDHITYQEIEQESYIEFKETMFEKIHRDIKFRKYGRIGHVLTIKADMLMTEIEKFKTMLEKNSIKFVHNWEISNVTIIKDGMLEDKCLEDEEGEEMIDEEY